MTDAELEQYIQQLREQNAQEQAATAQEQAQRAYYGQEASTAWQRLMAILRGERPTRETNEQWRARMAARGMLSAPAAAAPAKMPPGGMLRSSY